MGNRIKKLLGIHTGPTLYEKIFFRVSHPLFPTVLFFLTASLLVGWGKTSGGHGWPLVTGLLVMGLFLWTLIEYALHRYIFHWTTLKEPWKTFASGLHMAHHKDPDDPALIIAPPLISVPDSLVIFGILSLATWSFSLAAILLAGIQIGYVIYEWVHYGAHQYQWSFSLGKYLKKYHLTHHFKYPKEVFGVTVPFWDWVFRSNR